MSTANELARALLLASLLSASPVLADERFNFFHKVGVIQRAANACNDEDIAKAARRMMDTPEVRSVKNDDWLAADAIVVGVVTFNRRVDEQGLKFNCALVKELARREGYLK